MLNPFLAAKQKILLYVLVLLNVILDLKERDVHPSNKLDTKGGHSIFVVDVSFKWETDRNWHTKPLETWKLIQLNLLRQESVKVKQPIKLAVLPSHSKLVPVFVVVVVVFVVVVVLFSW